MSNGYKRPYIDKVYSCAKQNPVFPYSDETLTSRPFFDFFPLDGGAFHLSNSLLKYHWDARKFGEGCVTGELLEPWMKDGEIDWYKVVEDIDWTGLKPPMEAHVWLNRLYFLLPVAQRYLETGGSRYARRFFDVIADWDEKNPIIPREEIPNKVGANIWWDMQVAWRLIVCLYCAYMLRNASEIPEEDWRRLYLFMEKHAERLYTEAEGHLKSGLAHNHVLQIGDALLFTGICYPEMPNAEKYRKIGDRIIEMNRLGAILPDGGSIEASPSYSHFIARLYLEAYLLKLNNGMGQDAALLETIRKQYEWLSCMEDPQGMTLPLSDSYSMSTRRDFELAEKLLGETLVSGAGQNRYLPDSKCAAVHYGDFDLYIDALLYPQWHMHAGKPNLLLYFKGEPLIADAGCCSYDHHSLHTFLQSERAHSTVMIGSLETSKAQAVEDKVACTEADVSESAAEFNFDISGVRDGISFRRSRKIVLNADGLNVRDEVYTEKPCNVTALWQLAGFDVAAEGRKAQFVLAGEHLTMTADESLSLTCIPAARTEDGFSFINTLSETVHGTDCVMNMKIERE